jgi:polysaccharide chain length determinant protein (PEP-CTERM system associated)
MLPNRTFTPAVVLDMVQRRIGLFVIPVVMLFAALLVSSTIKNLYESDMLIAIIPQRVPDNFIRSTVNQRSDERLDELSVVVKSRTNLEQLITELNLYPEQRAKLPITDVIAIMNKDLEVALEPSRRGPYGPEPPRAFHVKFTYVDPRVAALVTQRIGAGFVEENSKGRTALAKASNSFLESELEQARRRLEEQEHRVEIFRQQHGKELPTQLQSNMEAIRGKQMQAQALVDQIARDRDRKLVVEALLRGASAERPVSSTQPTATATSGDPVAGGATGVSAQSRLATAKANLAGLLTRYTENHYDVKRLREQIAQLEKQAQAEAQQAQQEAQNNPTTTPAPAAEVVDPLEAQRREAIRLQRAELESLDRQITFKEGAEKALRDEIADYQHRIEAVPGIESEWVALNRDYDTIQTQYKELLAKSEAAKMAVNLEQREIGEQFRIVDPAQVPVHPVTSIRGAINGGGLVLGLVLALGIALFLEIRDKSFRSQVDVMDVLALPVLASVPRIVDAAAKTRQRNRRWALSAVALVSVVSAGYLTWALKLWNSLL